MNLCLESVSRKTFMKNYIVSCLQRHIDTLLSEIYFLREDIKEKNQLIKSCLQKQRYNAPYSAKHF